VEGEMIENNEMLDNNSETSSLAIIFRIVFGGLLALLVSPIVLILHALMFTFFLLSMFVIFVIGVLGSPAIIISKELKEILRKNLIEIYKKAMNSYKNILRQVTEQHIRSAFLWGKINLDDKAKKYESRYINFVVDNAVYIGALIFCIVIMTILFGWI
jgi:predicted PurR-regulated permease PerM